VREREREREREKEGEGAEDKGFGQISVFDFVIYIVLSLTNHKPKKTSRLSGTLWKHVFDRCWIRRDRERERERERGTCC
jgi:hypothetical protein